MTSSDDWDAVVPDVGHLNVDNGVAIFFRLNKTILIYDVKVMLPLPSISHTGYIIVIP
jgi:hypothetical protein